MGQLLLPALALLAAAPLQAQSGAWYEVRFDATWSAATHPAAYPNNAHFSPLIGATHDGSARLWQAGQTASAGMEQMAETGGTSFLTNQINNLIGQGRAAERLTGGGISSPGQRVIQVYVDEQHPLVSLVSMIAPSPDWFVGVDSVPLFQGGEWVDLVVDLTAWDAGTDSGTAFASFNQDTNPQDPIAVQTGGPFFGDDPLGTFTFTRLPQGTDYCASQPNSSGQPGRLQALGSLVAGDPLTLQADQLPTGQFGYFLVSATQAMSQPMGSSGTLCLGGNIGRFSAPTQVRSTGPDGRFTLVADTTALPTTPASAVQPGDTWSFQAWFGDTPATSNFTNGQALTFL